MPASDPPLLIVLARGSDGTGMRDLLEPATELIRTSTPRHVEVVDLDYPATVRITSMRFPGWVVLGKSPAIGVRRLTELLEDTASTPGDVALLGFSQGALVITETLSHPADRRHGGDVPELSSAALARIVVAVSVGNPSFRAGEPFNDGDPVEGISGMFARPAGVLDHVADRVVDIASADDVSAQHKMSSTMDGHMSYGRRGYPDVIARIVLDRLQ